MLREAEKRLEDIQERLQPLFIQFCEDNAWTNHTLTQINTKIVSVIQNVVDISIRKHYPLYKIVPNQFIYEDNSFFSILIMLVRGGIIPPPQNPMFCPVLDIVSTFRRITDRCPEAARQLSYNISTHPPRHTPTEGILHTLFCAHTRDSYKTTTADLSFSEAILRLKEFFFLTDQNIKSLFGEINVQKPTQRLLFLLSKYYHLNLACLQHLAYGVK